MFAKIRTAKATISGCRLCYTSHDELIPGITWEKFKTFPHRKALNMYLGSRPHIEDIRHIIPPRYTELKKRGFVDNLYLIDSHIAQDIANRILSFIIDKDRMICETNPGLGFVTSELLDGGLERVRLYETCPEFRLTLKGFNEAYPSRVELFVKDLFQIWKMSHMDKIDKGSRVMQFLKGVPTRNWSDEPIMTVIGTMPKLAFLRYVIKMICLQTEIATHGRIELFAIMRPWDYLKLIAGPHCNLHTYLNLSILSNVFCKLTLLEKYPRIAFLPWECPPNRKPDFLSNQDIDRMYLVHIEFKDELPVQSELLLPFYFFIKQLYGRGTTPVIQKLEKWIEGIGKEILLNCKDEELFENIDIFVKTGQLTPTTFVKLFKLLCEQSGFLNSPLLATVESELLKYETVESDIAEIKNPTVSSPIT